MKTKLSDIIIGCMTWGVWGKKLTTNEMTDLMHFCIDQGNTTFDHADIYGDYTTESEFGKAFSKSGINRKQVQLISKCGIQFKTATRDNRVKHYNYSKEYIIWSVEQSLKNLHTDYLDVLLLHRPSPLMQPDEIFEAIEKLQDQGKIIDFGVSNFTATQIDMLKENSLPVNFNQIEFSLVQNSAIEDGTLDYLLKNKIQAMSWSPLGKLFALENEQSQRIRPILNEFSKKYNVSENEILLAWILKHPIHITPVIGTTNKDRIKNANAAKNIQLNLEDWFILYEASRGYNVA